MKETIEIEVPSGKKVNITPMESGKLFTFEEKDKTYTNEIIENFRDIWLSSALGIPKKFKFTEDLLEREVCLADKTRIYMIEKYFTIYDNKSGKYIPFKLMDHQKLILKSFVENNGTIIKSYRQSGNTVLQEAFTACQMILNGNTNVLLLSSRLECSKIFIKEVNKFIEQYIKETGDKNICLQVNNSEEITLYSGASVKVINPRSEGIRINKKELDKVTHIIYDNAAFIEFNDDLLYELENNLPKNVNRVVISTDQKSNNWFKWLWYQTYKLDNDINGRYTCGELNKIELEWFNDPRFNKDLKWVKVQQNIIENGIEKVKQAYLPTNEWYVGMCKIFGNNKGRIEQEIGIGYNPNEDLVEIEKEDIREQILHLNNRLQDLKTYYYN